MPAELSAMEIEDMIDDWARGARGCNRPVLPGSRSQPGMDISSTSFYPRGRIDGKTTMAGISPDGRGSCVS